MLLFENINIGAMLYRSLLVDDGSSDNSGNNDNTDGGDELGSSHSRDAYEFIAFILWYAAMITCCVVPTCCAYRRRRRVERHLYSQQQRTVDNFVLPRHQEETLMLMWSLYGVGEGLNVNHNQVLMLQSLDSEAAVRERTKRLEVAMEEETFLVKDGDIVCNANTNANTNANANANKCTGNKPTDSEAACDNGDDEKEDTATKGANNDEEFSETECDDIERGSSCGGSTDNFHVSVDVSVDVDADENNAELRLPTSRRVPDICAICLCPYEVGDRVTYSEALTPTMTKSDEDTVTPSQSSCPHAFHTDCIVEWLAKKNDAHPECPCCRRSFCTVVPITTADLGNHYNRIVPAVNAPITSASTSSITRGDAGGSGSTSTTQTATIYRVYERDNSIPLHVM
mmetsp:Transcript_23461/g.51340  ORF Transcript_23461/g.51340 Transcript_23461/m.51340 type:complete len:399 (-) Transcript_23461:67-1263(-)